MRILRQIKQNTATKQQSENKREYLEKYSLFSENIPLGWTVPFEFSGPAITKNSSQMESTHYLLYGTPIRPAQGNGIALMLYKHLFLRNNNCKPVLNILLGLIKFSARTNDSGELK